ncbi:hypothetical protein [Roseovarius autotrophicus]|uniref:hypothetical protein n=1 Tax=Roseovarius autotrophicus TaxID=2824121 RepID=UPI001B38DEF5|nr:hypothetical protein [Roseovarius autotrophicus]
MLAIQQVYLTAEGRKAPVKVVKRTNKAVDGWAERAAVRLLLQDTTEFSFKRSAPEKVGFTKISTGRQLKEAGTVYGKSSGKHSAR